MTDQRIEGAFDQAEGKVKSGLGNLTGDTKLKVEGAAKYYHSTAMQAATIARNANVGQLMLGHYSARYNNEELLLEEARTIFKNTILANEKLVVSVK